MKINPAFYRKIYLRLFKFNNMKINILLTIIVPIICYITACNNVDKNHLSINLDNTTDTIRYSEFAKSLDYIQLDTKDSCLISNIKSIYMDEDTFCLLDKRGAGIFVFTSTGEFVCQINYFGQAPHEFIDITSFTIDPYLNQICIWDVGSRSIKKYTYKGAFVEAYRTDALIRDFMVFQDKKNLFILPFYSKECPYCIWIEDQNNQVIKNFNYPKPQNDQFEFISTYCNKEVNSLYYYDRNYDQISYITPDTLYSVYSIDLKQRLSNDLRAKNPASIKLENFAMMWNFSFSPKYLLMNYYYYGQEKPYKWVLLNRNTNITEIANDIINDIDSVQTETQSIFFLNERTWCRAIESTDPNNCNITLQMINLK